MQGECMQEGEDMNYVVALLCSLMLSTSAFALEVTQSGVNLQVRYTEPVVTSNGTPLDDLAYTTITVLDGTAILEEVTVPATALTGGGAIVRDVLFQPIAGQKKTYTIEVTASDTNIDPGPNVSLPATSSIIIDREAPGAPQ